MRYEVRCCCNPRKLLGTVETQMFAAAGRDVVFPQIVSDRVARWRDPRHTSLEEHVVRLTFSSFAPGGGTQPYLALKSNDTPIEELRLVPSFVEEPCTT